MARSRKSTIFHRQHTLVRSLAAAALLLLPILVRAEDEGRRVVVLSTSGGLYRTAADALVEKLRESEVDCELLLVPSTDAEARQRAAERLGVLKPDVIVAGGSSMSQWALEAVPGVPVVFFLVPNALDAAFLQEDSPHRDRVAGVTSDIAAARQIEWVRKTHAKCKRVAVLCSGRSEQTAEALKVAGRAQGVEITPIPASRERFPAAIDALNAGSFDGALMIPDSLVYNSPNVQRLLLWGLRQKRPVWTFSAGIVESGAFAGIYSDSARVGHQAAEIVGQILRDKRPQLIGLQYFHRPDRAVNSRTAEMIGVKFGRSVLSPGVTKYGD